MNRHKTAAVIGAGPAGLMAAGILAKGGVTVDLYDSMPSAGLKFLRAGKGGLNITSSEPYDVFVSRYRKGRQYLEPFLARFGPVQIVSWLHEIGVGSFTGSSGRIFPADMKAAPLLKLWLESLSDSGVSFHMRHSWIGWDEENRLKFRTESGILSVYADVTVLAMGGGSWKHLGSDGSWVSLLEQKGINISSLKASNCGFRVEWSNYFRTRFEGQPVKPVTVSAGYSDGSIVSSRYGEIMITRDGLEGVAVYFVSSYLREITEKEGRAVVVLDLAPGKSVEKIAKALSRPRGSASMSNHLRKCTGIERVKAGLLREVLSAGCFNDSHSLAAAIKALPLEVLEPMPLDEAISSAGGVCLEALDENLMLKNMPGVFCAGEMLDWDAPTGGYLLTACLSTGRAAGEGALRWIAHLC